MRSSDMMQTTSYRKTATLLHLWTDGWHLTPVHTWWHLYLPGHTWLCSMTPVCTCRHCVHLTLPSDPCWMYLMTPAGLNFSVSFPDVRLKRHHPTAVWKLCVQIQSNRPQSFSCDDWPQCYTIFLPACSCPLCSDSLSGQELLSVQAAAARLLTAPPAGQIAEATSPS